jgi:hypothetical protein
MKSGTCPKCRSSEIRFTTTNAVVSTSNWRWGDVPVVQYICLQCGFIEAYVGNIEGNRARLESSAELHKLA